MVYEIKLEQFSGPLEKLLELIESRSLDIAVISLAEVTADFLKYLTKNPDAIQPDTVADFLVVASKLVLIKSKTLLPSLELSEQEEHDIKDLEARLLIYREFAARSGGAAVNIRKLWERETRAFSRPLFASLEASNFFYPSPNLNLDNLFSALNNLIVSLRELLPQTSVIKTAIISLEEKIAELVNRTREAVRHTFKNLSKDRPRSEIIVMFLAVLHLFREKMIEAEQDSQFGDILIKKYTNDIHRNL